MQLATTHLNTYTCDHQALQRGGGDDDGLSSDDGRNRDSTAPSRPAEELKVVCGSMCVVDVCTHNGVQLSYCFFYYAASST